MFRQIDNHKRTAFVGQSRATRQWMVTVMCDDGWEDILDYRRDVSSEAEGIAYLMECGFEEYDPNARLKAMGLKWNGYCYA